MDTRRSWCSALMWLAATWDRRVDGVSSLAAPDGSSMSRTHVASSTVLNPATGGARSLTRVATKRPSRQGASSYLPKLRRRALPLGLAMALITTLPFTPAKADHFVSDCGTKSNYFDGMRAFPTTWYAGVHASMRVAWASVCNTDYDPIENFTGAHSMVAGKTGPGAWAQSGYDRGYGVDYRHYAQQSRDGNTPLVTQWGAFIYPGEVHGYWQQFVASCSCIRSNVDLNTFITSSWNPFTYWEEPFFIQFQGEAAYTASDMPGSASYKAEFNGLQVQTLDGNFSDVPAGLLSGRTANPGVWTYGSTSSTSFDIWTVGL